MGILLLLLVGLAPSAVALARVGCPVEPPPAIATYDLETQLFDAAAPGMPPVSFDVVHLDESLLSRAVAFARLPIFARGNAVAALESGHRPLGFQQHRYTLKKTWEKLVDALQRPMAPEEAHACQALLDLVDADIDRHGILRTAGVGRGIPRVTLPRASEHTSVPARAVDITIAPSGILSDSELDALAALVGLKHASRGADPFHFTRRETSPGTSGEWFSGLGWSPLNILVTDPRGRRVGFDPATGVEVNEIGADASYSGPGTTPQVIDIVGLVPGDYELSAVGTGEGQFTLRALHLTEKGTVVQQRDRQGVASPGRAIEAIAVRVPPPATGNEPPIAAGGPDRTVTPGTEVTLEGSGSVDPDGGPGPLGFAWLQTAGRPVFLSSDVGMTTRFIPQVAGTYTFALVVSDGQDSSAPSRVTITVEEAPPAVRQCSVLGIAGPASLLDQDVFRFDGVKGERVVITLARNGAGTSEGDHATLRLVDATRGVTLIGTDDALPSRIAVTLPRTGRYHVVVAEQVRALARARFRGAYCLSLDSSAGAQSTLAAHAGVE
jgi:K319-like protein